METNAFLKLDLEGMRLQVVHAFSAEMLEMEKKVDAAVKAVVEDFNFEQELNDYVQKIYREKWKMAVEFAISRQLEREHLKIEAAATKILESREFKSWG